MKKFLRTTLIVYLLTWLAVFLMIVVVVMLNEGSFMDGVINFRDMVPNSSFLIGIHVFFAQIFTVFLLIRYFVRTFRKRGFLVFLKRLSLFILLPATLLFTTYKIVVHINSEEDIAYNWDPRFENKGTISKDHYSNDGKHRGMSVFGWRQADMKAISPLVKNNVEWVAVIPFFYQQDEQTSKLRMRDSYDTWSRRDSMFIEVIDQLHQRNLRVHFKPHLWMNSGWRSNINLTSKRHWDSWFDSYRITMLHYARMAQETQVDLFCIGTELKTTIKEQPQKWCDLIAEIKAIYHGKLTYAANWDGDYDVIPFWDELDYIGIQAYFPLTEVENPDLEAIKRGWDEHIQVLESLSRQHDKPILFTEVGYKSEASATIRPWEWGSAFGTLYKQKSDLTQLLAYEALFQKLWHREWFAGIYIWQWDIRSKEEKAAQNINFSPRFKPAENVIAKWFGNIN